MKRFLLTTTAIVAFAMHVQSAGAADIDPVGNVDYPTTFLSFEGGIVFDSSPSNLSFDKEDDKLGDLGSLKPGDWGGEGRFEFGQQLDSQWDYKLGLAAIFLNDDSSRGRSNSSGVADASQKTSLQTFDAEVGYRPDDMGGLQTRLFAGVRGLHASSDASWAYHPDDFDPDSEKLGEFNDEVYAIGPRIGVDLTMPITDSGVSLVGSASGSVLFGNVESQYDYHSNGNNNDANTDWSGSQTIWNVEGMAGVSFDIGKNADLTLGYRAAQFSGLMTDRSDVDKQGNFNADGSSNLLIHGPFARLTVEFPG